MVIFLSLLLCAVLVAFCLIAFKIRRIVCELSEAVQLNRRLLLNEPLAMLRQLGFEKLILETNELMDRYHSYANMQSGHLNQLEATLGSIQEAVIIFNDQHIIEYVNQSAQRLLQRAQAVKGVRLETVLRSSSLLEFLNMHRNDKTYQLQQVSVERQGEVFWFEVSCAEVRGVSAPNVESTLLVLHDITRLKSLEEVRRDFVANVSHELRTPLTIIKGFAETLVQDNDRLPTETRLRFLNKIVNNAERLNVLVEDLLVLSRLESKPEQIEPAVQSFKQLLEEILENYRSRLKESQKMILEFDEQIEEFAFDRFRMHQVFDNLIENALRYAPDLTLLTLRVCYDGMNNFVKCMVADDGPGIPEKDVPHIFERFYRVDKGRSRDSGGTGLGLSIIKHIVQQHGGTVSAKSKIGEGTSIHFNLPYIQSLQVNKISKEP